MRVLSLCSGVGGLDLGIKLVLPAALVVAYVEKDPYCQAVLRARMAERWLDEGPIFDDLTAFDGCEWRGTIDLICGGFPCQDISQAGRREGIREGNRSGLWSEFARVIGEVGPGYVFVENVAALLGRGLDIVLGDLAGLGFDAEWTIVSAAEVGAPHLRERVFVLAYSQCAQRGQDDEHRRQRPCEGPGSDSVAVADARGQPGEEDSARNGECLGDDGEAIRPISGPGGGAVVAISQGLDGELWPGAGRRPGRPASNGGAVGHTDHKQQGRLSVGTDREPVADTGGAGLLGNTTSPGDGGRTVLDGTGDIGLFPPGPEEAECWAAVLRDGRHLEPAIRKAGLESPVCDLADGTTDWLGIALTARGDQLRVLGNAVVPASAALAFRTLAARIGQ